MDTKTFTVRIIELLESAIPELADRIQAGAVDAKTGVPFAAFTMPDEQPIRTKCGIAGYVVSFEVSVYHNRVSQTEQLRHKVIAALEGASLGEGARASYRSSQTDYYPDYDIHGATLHFRIVHYDN